MAINRSEKIEERIRELIAPFIERMSNKTSLITITRVFVYEHGRKGTIFVSVLPANPENELSAVNFLKRQRKEMKHIITKGLGIHLVPFLDVEIDKGEKARQTIDALLKQE